MIRKVLFLFLFLIYSKCLFSSNTENLPKEKSKPVEFTLDVIIPTTSVKDQCKTNTCWSFATLSFIESELIRKENKEYDFSEMFVVRNVYKQKASKYIRMHGATNFSGGGEPNDVTDIIKDYGIVPEGVYTGLLTPNSRHEHTEMDHLLKDYVDRIVKNTEKSFSKNWQDGFTEIMDKYLGTAPDKFEFEGKVHTPLSLASSLSINPDDYVLIGSFTHHPFYSSFILEIPDNWSWAKVYNLPLGEFVELTDSALNKGYSMVWAADITEKGFLYSQGIAFAPSALYDVYQQEYKKYSRMSEEKLMDLYKNSDKPIHEIRVTQELRQIYFDNYATTDDHGMHLLGKGTDKHGSKYYYIKNSWGTENKYGGYMYISEAYFQLKSISVMLHKDAIPVLIRKKLNI